MEELQIYTESRIQRIRKKRAERKKRRFRQRLCVITVLAAIVTGSFVSVYAASAKEIIITEIDEFANTVRSSTVKTRAADVNGVLSEQGIMLSDTDKLNLPTDSTVENNSEIILKRGKQIKLITPDGEETVVITSADPADAVRESGYVLDDTAEINISGDTLAASYTIEVRSVSYSNELETEEIPFETTYTNSAEIYIGESRTVTEGKNGVRTKTYQVARYADGSEKSRELISDEITEQPVNKVIANGTKEMPANMINGHTYSKKIVMNATAYCNITGNYKTFTGKKLQKGCVAVDPNVIPLGTRLYIVSNDGKYMYGEAVAEDKGTAIKGNKIDLCFTTMDECRQFGRRDVTVYVLN